eukprot:GHVS01028298.1.p2 GENE.GHVS01028298.1~~GHVS01028298.1.p2  ORF type:complete len:219 (+),score=61.71 GHVS01028298.1:356-1012(+)
MMRTMRINGILTLIEISSTTSAAAAAADTAAAAPGKNSSFSSATETIPSSTTTELVSSSSDSGSGSDNRSFDELSRAVGTVYVYSHGFPDSSVAVMQEAEKLVVTEDTAEIVKEEGEVILEQWNLREMSQQQQKDIAEKMYRSRMPRKLAQSLLPPPTTTTSQGCCCSHLAALVCFNTNGQTTPTRLLHYVCLACGAARLQAFEEVMARLSRKVWLRT